MVRAKNFEEALNLVNDHELEMAQVFLQETEMLEGLFQQMQK